VTGVEVVIANCLPVYLSSKESRDVIGHLTVRLPAVDFLWVVHCDHAFI